MCAVNKTLPMSQICSDVQSYCRVDAPRISTLESRGGECATDQGVIGDLGSSKTVTSYGVTYYHPGVVVREFNHPPLRLPQKREFLGPEFFNSGCATLYGNTRFDSGPNSALTDAAATRAMFDYNFASRPYFEGNNASCYNAGVKCTSPNSALGWMMDPSGKLLWQSTNAAELNAVCAKQQV